MPYDDPDATDPMTLHGVEVEAESDAAMREMAECFVEEYIRLGFDADRILKMFQTQGYAGPFLAYQTFGEECIRALIDEHLQRRGPHPHRSAVEPRTGGDIALPVLDGWMKEDCHE